MDNANLMATSSIEDFIFDFVDFIWEVNAQGVYTYVAGNVEGILGYKPEEILGKTPFDLMPEDEAKKIAEVFITIAQNTEPINDLVNWNLHKNGSAVCLLTCGKPFFSKSGEYLGYRGIDKDITHKHLQEERLKKRFINLLQWSYNNEMGLTETIKKILELASEGLEADRVSFWSYTENDNALECTDLYDKAEQKHTQNGVLHKESFPLYFEALGQRKVLRLDNAREDTRSAELTEPYLKLNNIFSMLDMPVFSISKPIGVICCEYSAKQKNFVDEDVEFVLAISEIISKAIEQDKTKTLQADLYAQSTILLETNENFQLALNAANAGTFSFDAQANILHWDKNSMDIFGVDEDSFDQTYKAWEACVVEEDLLELNELVMHQLNTSDTLDIRYKINYDGKDIRHIWAIGSIVRNDNNEVLYVSGLHFDESEKMALQKELKDASNKAVLSSNAKSDFLSSMSHEIRTPLNAIMGFTSLIQKEENLSVKIKDNLSIIENSSQHLMDVINQVLELSKIEAGKLELINTNFNLKSLVDDVDNMVKIRVQEKGLEYKSSFHAQGSSYINTDGSKLKQVLINLIGNAVKFTEKGFIHLDVSMKNLENGYCELVLVVQDSGRGIPKEKIDTIFEPYTQASLMDQAQGSGLGLTISKKIINLMDGKIEVDSDIEKGTRFSIQAKVLAGKVEEKIYKFKRVDRLAETSFKPTIMVVDDIAVNRLLLRTYLEEAGFNVVEAGDGEKAVEIALSHSPDLIWMDLKMPIMDGYTATSILKNKHHYKGSILALSANIMNKDSDENKIFDDFLVKPFNESEMFDLMKRYLGLEYVYKEEE